MARKTDMSFEMQPEHRQFILARHAELVKPAEILDMFMIKYSKHLKDDIEQLGFDTVKKRLKWRINDLHPRSKNFPEHLRSEYDKLHHDWVESASQFIGYHRTGRLSTLESLLDQTLKREFEEGFGFKEQAKLVLDIVKEMRQEGDKAQIHLEQRETAPAISDELKESLKLLSPEQIQMVKDASANGEPVTPLVRRLVGRY